MSLHVHITAPTHLYDPGICVSGSYFSGKRTFLNSMQNVSTLNTLGIRVNWIERKCSVENSSYLYSDFTGNTGLSLVLKAVIVAQLC